MEIKCRHCKGRSATLLRIRNVTPVAVCSKCHGSFIVEEEETDSMLVRTCDMKNCKNPIPDGKGEKLTIKMSAPVTVGEGQTAGYTLEVDMELCDVCAKEVRTMLTPDRLWKTLVGLRAAEARKAKASGKPVEPGTVGNPPLTM